MKRVLFLTFAMLCTVVQSAWAQTEVSTDKALRNAIADKANITVTADIILSNSTLSIPEGKTVTINLNNHTLDRGRTSREWNTGGQVITVRKDATLNLSNGTLKGGWGGDGDATGIRNLPPPYPREREPGMTCKVASSRAHRHRKVYISVTDVNE